MIGGISKRSVQMKRTYSSRSADSSKANARMDSAAEQFVPSPLSPAHESTVTSRYFKSSPPAKRRRGHTDVSAPRVSDIESVSTCVNDDGGNTAAQTFVRLGKPFFDVDCAALARKLLGCTIARRNEGTGDVVRARIVETEAYLGGTDKAAHSFDGKKTKRNAAMYMVPGTLYVYVIYGMYHCTNVSSRGDGAAVLLRSVEPFDADSELAMRKARAKSEAAAKKMKLKDIGSGPGRLGQALGIRVEMTTMDATALDSDVWFEEAIVRPCSGSVKQYGASCSSDKNIVTTKRVGVDYADEWAEKPLRFYLLDSPCVSVRDKITEKLLQAASPS